MKKADKITFAVDIVIGIGLMVTGLVLSVDYYSSLLFAMGFALTANILVQLARHYYNTRPENIEAYREKTRRQAIELKDERKVRLRNQAGYITWAGTMVLCFIAAFVAALVHAEAWLVGIFFGAAVAEYIIAAVIYQYLCRRM